MGSVAVHLDRLLEPIAGCFSPEVAAKVADLRWEVTNGLA